MDYREKIKNIIIKELNDEYRRQALYLKQDPEEIIKQNAQGLEQFANSLAAKINIIIEN